MKIETMHPLSSASNSRIDIMHGGRESDAMQDVMLLMHQSVVAMQRGEKILLINSLCEHDELARACDRIGRGRPGKVTVFSASGAKLREKLEFLSLMISQKNIRMIVVNSFEFAASGSRQKHALAHWLRAMRDAHKLRVVVYSYEPDTPRQGALFGLSFVASYVDKVGAWQYDASRAAQSVITGTQTVVRYAEAVDKVEKQMEQQRVAAREKESATPAPIEAPAAPIEASAPEATTNTAAILPTTSHSAMTMPRREWCRKLNFISPEQLQNQLVESLKNNDLTPVGARSEAPAETVLNEEEYAMAA